MHCKFLSYLDLLFHFCDFLCAAAPGGRASPGNHKKGDLVPPSGKTARYILLQKLKYILRTLINSLKTLG